MKPLTLILLLGLAAACNNKKEPAEPTDPASAPAERPEPVEPAEPAQPGEPADEPVEDPCVEQCLQENQARAVGWDQIKRECEERCKEQ